MGHEFTQAEAWVPPPAQGGVAREDLSEELTVILLDEMGRGRAEHTAAVKVRGTVVGSEVRSRQRPAPVAVSPGRWPVGQGRQQGRGVSRAPGPGGRMGSPWEAPVKAAAAAGARAEEPEGTACGMGAQV